MIPLAPTVPVPDVIPVIREQYRLRCDYHSAEKRLVNQIKAIGRRLGQPLTETHAADAEQNEGGGHSGDEPQESLAAALVSVHLDEARVLLKGHRLRAEKELARLAKQLPVWPWWEAQHGLGALGLAQVVGECGDPSDYATVSKLWKRMGLAVMDGERQRKVTGPAALEHGYSPRRRAVMWNIGGSMMKAKEKGAYYPVYLKRKAVEIERPACGRSYRTASGAMKACKGTAGNCRKAHIHNRAKRYMEKRILRDLWAAWRAIDRPAKASMIPNDELPAVSVEGGGDHAPGEFHTDSVAAAPVVP